MKVLCVDDGGICVAQDAALILQSTIAARIPGVSALSAGVATAPGQYTCPESHAGRNGGQQPVRPFVRELGLAADLILTDTRATSSAVVDECPEQRNAVFTLRQAQRWSQWLLDQAMVEAAIRRAIEGKAVSGNRVEPMPASAEARNRWIVTELDAARGVAPRPVQARGQSRHKSSQLDSRPYDDLASAHGTNSTHAQTLASIVAAIMSLEHLMATVHAISLTSA